MQAVRRSEKDSRLGPPSADTFYQISKGVFKALGPSTATKNDCKFNVFIISDRFTTERTSLLAPGCLRVTVFALYRLFDSLSAALAPFFIIKLTEILLFSRSN